jgi:uncharacterized protein YndB with AHSA1/START domain
VPINPESRRTDTASRLISAPPDAVYQAFEQPASLMAWLPPSGMHGHVLEYDFREGGSYQIELRYDEGTANAVGKTTDQSDVTSGRFVELKPGRRITQSVLFDSGEPALAGEMTITWAFQPAPGGTQVTVTAANVPPGISKADHDAGLRSSLDNLAHFFE